MNRLVLLLGCIIISLPLWAQISVSAHPESFSLSGQPTNADVNIHIDVVNNSPIEVRLLWSRTIESAPSEWLSWICDKNLCYLPTSNACSPSKPNILAPGEHMDFQIHVDPQTIEGATGYDVYFTDTENPDVILAEIHGDILINNTVSTNDQNANSKLTVFPNPTSDYFQVSETVNLKGIELFNIVGSKVRTYDTSPQKQYYIGDLNNGIYLVRLVSSTNKVLKTIRLIKK